MRGTLLQRWKERGIHGWLLACALLSVATTAGIIYVLVSESVEFFRHVSLIGFLTGTQWRPLLEPQSFGVLPLVAGSALVAAGGLAVAIPVGLASAIYLSEYAPPRVRSMAKPVLEILAGIPTVVYGYFALTVITPYVLRPLFGQNVQVFNAASAAIVVGIMIVPTISSLL